MKDKINWFGEKGNDGIEVVKTAGRAIGATLGLVVIGITLGAVNQAFDWS